MEFRLVVQIDRPNVTDPRGITVVGKREIILNYEVPRNPPFVMVNRIIKQMVSGHSQFRNVIDIENIQMHRIAYIGNLRASDAGITELAVALLHRVQDALKQPRLVRS